MTKDEIIAKLEWLATEGRSLGPASWTDQLLGVVIEIAKKLPDKIDERCE